MANINNLSNNKMLDNQIVKLMSDYTKMGIIICNNREEIVEANKHIMELIGLNQVEIVGKKFSKFFKFNDDDFVNIKEVFELDPNGSRALKLNFESIEGVSIEINS